MFIENIMFEKIPTVKDPVKALLDWDWGYLLKNYTLKDILEKINTLRLTDEMRNLSRRQLIDYQIKHANKIAEWQQDLLIEFLKLSEENKRNLFDVNANETIETHKKLVDAIVAAKTVDELINLNFITTQQEDETILQIKNLNKQKVIAGIPRIQTKEVKIDGTTVKNIQLDYYSNSVVWNGANKIQKEYLQVKDDKDNVQKLKKEDYLHKTLPELIRSRMKVLNTHVNVYKCFIDNIKELIENTEWQIGIFGGSTIEIEKGKISKKTVPTRVAEIYKVCKETVTNDNWKMQFEKITQIGVAGSIDNKSFLFFNRRQKTTQEFYDKFKADAEETKQARTNCT